MLFSHLLNRNLIVRWLMIASFILILSACAPLNISSTQTTPSMPSTDVKVIDTWDNIHTFLTFDDKISNPSGIANRYDFVWGAEVNHAQELVAGNPAIFLSYYIAFHRDMGTFTQDGGVGRLPYWKSAHPDWILYKCDRVTPAYEYSDSSVPLDFSNPAVISWQLQTYAIPASNTGYQAIAADNLNLQNLFGACGIYKNGKWMQLYTGQVDDPNWQVDVISWLKSMHSALHSLPHPMALIPNLSVGALGVLSPGKQLVQQLLNNLDGIVDEGGFTNYAQGYLTDENWIARIQFIKDVQELHKPYYIINLFPNVGSTQIQWALSCYLISKEHSSALYVSTVREYGSDTWHKEYYTKIGSPSDSMYQMQHVYVRDYSHGVVIINPDSAKTYTVNLNTFRHYTDIYGNTIAPTVKMPPHSGMILLIVD